MIRWLPQSLEVASHSYDVEMKALTRDGLMSDTEIESDRQARREETFDGRSTRFHLDPGRLKELNSK